MPTIETERLLLRMFRPEDLDELARLFSDPQVVKYVGEGQPVSREETERALNSIIRHWQTHGFGRWAVVDKQTREFVGFGGLRSLFGTAEVVYHLATAHWGKGLATELARASLRFGFEEHRFDRIVAIAKPLNAASIHVMEKIGMHYEKHASYYDIEVVQYGIRREEFSWDGSGYDLKQETKAKLPELKAPRLCCLVVPKGFALRFAPLEERDVYISRHPDSSLSSFGSEMRTLDSAPIKELIILECSREL